MEFDRQERNHRRESHLQGWNPRIDAEDPPLLPGQGLGPELGPKRYLRPGESPGLYGNVLREFLRPEVLYRPTRPTDPEDLFPKDGKLTIPEEECQDYDLIRRVVGYRSRREAREAIEAERLGDGPQDPYHPKEVGPDSRPLKSVRALEKRALDLN